MTLFYYLLLSLKSKSISEKNIIGDTNFHESQSHVLHQYLRGPPVVEGL